MTYTATELTRTKRLHKRGHYDAETVHAILDAQPLCSVAYVFDGRPVVTPTLQWREGSHIYWHGSSASRMLENCIDAQVCVNVTIFDGIVMARAAFNHSCSYRSVMAFGTAYKVTDASEKEARMRAMMQQLYPGRWEMLRPMTAKELKATTVLGMELREVSAKVRSGPPGDDEEDYVLPIWAGVVPLTMTTGTALPCPRLLPDVAEPKHAAAFKIG